MIDSGGGVIVTFGGFLGELLRVSVLGVVVLVLGVIVLVVCLCFSA